MSERRQYRMRERAKSQNETRRRIVEATMELHEEIGPRATTISAIADRAGVQRLTVYRHFPNEAAVFQACTSQWMELNPLPSPSSWEGIEDAKLRLKKAAGLFYDYYSRTRQMWSSAFRDAPDVPALHGPMADVAAEMRKLTDGLIRPFGTGKAVEKIAPTIRHALHFMTWQELDEQGLPDSKKVDLVAAWLDTCRKPA